MYNPSKRQKMIAKRIGVEIYSSSNKKKKLSVYKNGVKVADIGASGYMDYDMYLRHFGKAYANERKRLYKIRHQKYRIIKDTPAYYADKILWT
jgi:hypothetical protein